VTVAWGRDERTGRPAPVAVTKGGKSRAAGPAAFSLSKAAKAKPLVPLHLRPPIRHRVKPGATFIECPCGERLLLRSGAVGRALQCPACDRFHQVEEDAPAAALPASPAPLPAAPGAPAPSRPLRIGEFACKCGEIQPPRTSRTGKSFECAKCGRQGHVEPVSDPKGGLPSMRPVFTHEPEAAKAVSGPAWTCACGASVPASPVLARTLTACPSCGRGIRLEQTRDTRAPKTMIRPVFSDPAPAPPEPAVAFEELEPLEQAPPSIPEDAPLGLCACGAELYLSDEMLGRTVQCPACSDLLAVERGLDGKGLRVRTVGTVAEPGEWTIDEFR
jgi:hypothetical protein